MRYFEVEFGDTQGISDYSICIIGKRKPSIEEAEKFCSTDMKNMNYKYVINVIEIEEQEARTFFDMEDVPNFPVFE